MQPHCVPSACAQYPGGVQGWPGAGGAAGQVHEHRSVSPTPLPGPPPTHVFGVKHELGGQMSLPQLHCWAPPHPMMVRHEGLGLSPYVHVRPSSGQAPNSAGAVDGHADADVVTGHEHGQLPG